MAMRGTPARRAAVVGGPLVGVVRELDRRSRSTTRSGARAAVSGPVPDRETAPGPAAPPVEPDPATPPPRAAAVVRETEEDGRVRWDFPEPFDAPPVVGALLAADGGGHLLTVALEAVTEARAQVRVWRLYRGKAVPAGAGLRVHLTATTES
ncbi:hypothetical protein PV392_16285 [Streptomyces sp. ME03-5709C]|nr:hypothetical protein [Streptomyces sp. ME03-5709C]